MCTSWLIALPVGLQFRRVLDQIRGRSYPEALALLEHMPFRACEPLKDLLIGVGPTSSLPIVGGLCLVVQQFNATWQLAVPGLTAVDVYR